MSRTLVACLLMLATGAVAAAVAPGTDEEIKARLEPFGKVCRAGDDCTAAVASTSTSGTATTTAAATTDAGTTQVAAAAPAKSGKEIYDTFCFACHATGISDSPKLGDVEAWAPRIAKGMDVLYANTINGINIMPPKGTCMACTDAELNAVVDYIIENSQ